MFSPLICGSFQDQEEDDFEFLRSCSQAKKPSRKPTRWHSFGGRNKDNNNNKNPYAGRGLDKFSALLAELDSKRQKIYTQKGSEDISLLGFVYSNSDDYKPIVVRLKKQPDKAKLDKKEENKSKTEATDNKVAMIEQPKGDVKLSRIESDIKTSPKNISLVWDRIKWKNLRRPGYYVPVIIILILVFLAIFGRSFAILCTTLGWYFIPTIQAYGSSGTSLKKMKKDYVKALSYNNNKIVSSGDNDKDLRKTKTMKKDYVKALSYNNKIMASTTDHHGLLSPKSVLTGDKSPPQGGHRRSF